MTPPSALTEQLDKSYQFLAKKIANMQKTHVAPVFFVGLNGCQGAGKSTLVHYLKQYIESHYALSVVCLSLDDFYLSSAQRKRRANTVHPLFSTRGVPGTHDTDLLKKTLSTIMQVSDQYEALPHLTQKSLKIPRFNKALDEPVEIEAWPVIKQKADIVLFEGWCWGVSAQPSGALIKPINALEYQEDKHCVWRQTVNQFLHDDYQPLYSMMDYWVMLKAPNFDCVFQWRLAQEQQLAKHLETLKENSKQLKSQIISAKQLQRFILHFERLTTYALNTLPEQVDCVIELDKRRQVINQWYKNEQCN